MVHYKKNLDREASRLQKKYDGGATFSVTELKKLFRQRDLVPLIQLKYETWSDVMLRARFARVDRFRDAISKGDLSKEILWKMSAEMPDLAIETINHQGLTWKQFMWASHALGKEHWKQITTYTLPNADDPDGIEWMLRKAINMGDKGLYDDMVKEYNIEPSHVLSTKMYRKSSFREPSGCECSTGGHPTDNLELTM